MLVSGLFSSLKNLPDRTVGFEKGSFNPASSHIFDCTGPVEMVKFSCRIARVNDVYFEFRIP